MAMIITMPRLSPTMEEGVLAKWLKKEGDRIAAGDIVAEVETDKANMDFPIEDDGVLLKLLVSEGATVRLGAPVAILGKAGEDIAALLAQASNAAPAATAPAAKAAPSVPPAPVVVATPQMPSAAVQAGGRVLASPLARRMAEQQGLALQQIAGSGPRGRIIKRDVESVLQQGSKAPATPSKQDVVTPLSMMRKTIARRLVEAKQTIPHFYLTIDVQMDALWDLRQQMNAVLQDTGGKVSVNDLIVKAVARALRVLPAANASFSDEGIVQHGRVDVGVAVSMPDGLITPVVRGADAKSVATIAAEIRDLADRGRQKKLAPQEYQGACFTVSNLGMFGIQQFAAIVNPPESGILAVGQVEKRAVVIEEDGEDCIVSQRRMTMTLSCDHRVVDGSLGAQLLAEIKKGLEQPLLLVM